MRHYKQIILILFGAAIIWASIWVPLVGQIRYQQKWTIISYHWIWNTDKIFWDVFNAIPTQVDFQRVILAYVAITATFAIIYLGTTLLLRKKTFATQSGLEFELSKNNIGCARCDSDLLVGVDGKRSEVLLICPKCETEWYFRLDTINNLIPSIKQSVGTREPFDALKNKLISIKKIKS